MGKGEKCPNPGCVLAVELRGVCLSAGTQTPDPGGGRWLPVHRVLRDGARGLRVGLGDAGAEPAAVRVVRQHLVRAGAPRRRGQAPGAALHLRERPDR